MSDTDNIYMPLHFVIQSCFTTCKRSLGQGNVFFTCVPFCSQGVGGLPNPWRQTLLWMQTPLDANPLGLGRPPTIGQTPLDTDPWGWADPPDADPLGLGRLPWMQTPRIGQTPQCRPLGLGKPPPRYGH